MPKAHPKDQKITLSHLAKHYSDEGKAYEFLEAIRWPNGPICPHCGGVEVTFLQPRDGDARATRTGHATQRRVWQCRACRKQFSVLIGTIFEGSKIPLSKWLLGMHLLCAGKNGVSSHELARTLEITVKSAWFMSHRLRYAMENPRVAARIEDKLSGTVEADETYVGGRPRYKAASKAEAAQRRMDNKTVVVSLVERGGKVRSRVMKRVTGANIKEVLAENVDLSARLMTDESKLYPVVGRTFTSHETVNHSAGEYVRGDAYTNTVEGYFSQLKRSLDGTHHHVSAHHLHRYVGEFDHRYNTREMEDGDRTVLTIKQAEGKRLQYRESVSRSDA